MNNHNHRGEWASVSPPRGHVVVLLGHTTMIIIIMPIGGDAVYSVQCNLLLEFRTNINQCQCKYLGINFLHQN